jgi:hypothetical protein
MKRGIAFGIGILLTALLAAPGTAGATGWGDDRGHRHDDRHDHDGGHRHDGGPSRTVEGTLTGPGGFRFLGCPGVVSSIGNGTYEARGLGSGTYEFTVCVDTSTFPVSFAGDMQFTESLGSTLTGTISGSFPGGSPGPSYTFTITEGTGRFARVGGELVIGPFVQTDQHNCTPALICFDWTDTAPITGTLTRVPHRCHRDRA